MSKKLVTLEKVDPRDIWVSESANFTPWLASEEGIKELSKVIGIDLVVESEEQSVGPYSADILCKDESNDNLVIIENQLEKTDHKHLGQILTYLAGVKALNAVWIATEFTDEHRAAIDLLNNETGDNFNFFGLEIEGYKIDDIRYTPRFNIICQPNNWSKSMKTARTSNSSEAGQKYLAFWTELKSKMKERKSQLKTRKPKARHYLNTTIGKSGFTLAKTVRTRKNTIGVELYIGNNKEAFKILESQKNEIEKEIGEELSWEFLPHAEASRIALYKENSILDNTSDWDKMSDWFLEKLEKFYQVFSQRIKSMEISETKKAA
jgi:hypothetical protein